MWMLDTNVCVDYFNGRAEVVERLQEKSPDDLRLSSVVVAELRFGADKSRHQARNHERIDILTREIQCLDFNLSTARRFGEIRAMLTRRGLVIGPYDMMIAAHASATDCVLVTDNVNEFQRVEGLVWENWRTGFEPDSGS